jgi:hypothetical protein
MVRWNRRSRRLSGRCRRNWRICFRRYRGHKFFEQRRDGDCQQRKQYNGRGCNQRDGYNKHRYRQPIWYGYDKHRYRQIWYRNDNGFEQIRNNRDAGNQGFRDNIKERPVWKPVRRQGQFRAERWV